MIDTSESFSICVCYLPPANSSRGNSANEFFDHLKSNMCSLQNIETNFICGDFNARCKNLADVSSSSLNIPQRNIVDMASANSRGKELIDFLRSSGLMGEVGVLMVLPLYQQKVLLW